MNFLTLDDDERVIAETAAAFAAKRLAPHALEWDRSKHFPVDVLREAAELGMAAIYCAEDVGGSGLRRLDAVRIFEQLADRRPDGRGVPVDPQHVRVDDRHLRHRRTTQVVGAAAGVDGGHRQLLPDRAGCRIGRRRRCAPRPFRDGEHYVLDGVKQFISGAGSSDVYVVMARTGGEGPRGISAFIVEKGTPGLSFGANEEKMGWNAQPTAQVIFEGVRVPADAMLGGPEGEGTGFGIAMNGLNGGRLNIAACSLGGAQAAYEQGGDAIWPTGRPSAGRCSTSRPSGSRWPTWPPRWRRSRLMLWRAAHALDNDDPDKVALCAMAKRYVTDACFDVADQALQLLGGYGYLREYGLEKIVRDLRVHRILEGTNEIMRVVIGRAVASGARNPAEAARVRASA